MIMRPPDDLQAHDGLAVEEAIPGQAARDETFTSLLH